MLWALRLVFATKRGLLRFITNSLAAFGGVSACVQFYGAVWAPSHGISAPGRFTLVVVMASLAWGVARAWPRRFVRYEFGRPDMTIVVKVGDLFDEDVDLVVGFSDTFDTDTTGDLIISSRSVQGQLLERRYGGDLQSLDRDLDDTLDGVKPTQSIEKRSSKPHGKLKRYPIGTVGVLRVGGRRVYAVACSRMGNDLVAKSSVHDLWASLGQVWEAVYVHGQRTAVAMPLVGSELALINCLDRESLLKMALLSFVSRSREELICRELRFVIHRRDYTKINMLEVEAFLRTL